jgi:hypothetical protein
MLGRGRGINARGDAHGGRTCRTMFMAGQVAGGLHSARWCIAARPELHALVGVDRGFDPRGLLTMRVPQPPKTTFAQRMTLLERLQPRLAGCPG